MIARLSLRREQGGVGVHPDRARSASLLASTGAIHRGSSEILDAYSQTI
jgi:hypothetical protein